MVIREESTGEKRYGALKDMEKDKRKIVKKVETCVWEGLEHLCISLLLLL